MSLFLRRMLVFFKVLSNVSFLVSLASIIIFIFDIEGTKGLMPIIFINLFLFFGSQFNVQFIMVNYYRNKKFNIFLNPYLILSIVSLLLTLLSITVFWL